MYFLFYNKFSKAVFLGNSGEYFYATKKEQDIASNALQLIQNSIICWNYLYFAYLIAKEKDSDQQNKIINTLKNGSIVHSQHINFYGEYDFTEKALEEEFDMDAIKVLSKSMNGTVMEKMLVGAQRSYLSQLYSV
ncbi:MAG: Tn3 family transposase [Sulfuricurvum sp.]|uniref:Tn3 family transposase n=1 Tax=Sulfuricurvum sp. TaxID=2025608 RepID=UPI0027368465|nr:Tn3 family transposase [Sulfuricurvum sp.]MDP2849509.1 Tn3 family transposase [Sulfuricurvum sp.]